MTSLFILTSKVTAFASSDTDHPPAEAIVLKLSKEEYANWQEAYRQVKAKKGTVQYVSQLPIAQKDPDAIEIEFHALKSLDKKSAHSIEKIVERVQKTIYSDFKKNNVQWKIIENRPNDIIYEWISSKPSKKMPPQHQIARSFLTHTGWHQIVVTHPNGEMSPADREKWINTLKESASVAPYDEAAKTTQSLSMAERTMNSLDLGETFQDWKTVSTYLSDTGYTLACRIPPGHSESLITECLELATMPNLNNNASLQKLFEIEKESVSKSSPTKVNFDILKKSPTEVIYSYSCPRNSLCLTGVVRSFITDRGYYSISYRRGLDKEMKKDEILQAKDRLETIKVREGF